MLPSGYQVRRATVDDLSALRPLWQAAQLPVAELEKRFTEFQVVWDDAGEVLGAIGLQIVGPQAYLHSELFFRPELQEDLRPALWDRLHKLAQNHGLARIWTCETAPFWERYVGFKPATEAELAERPAGFGEPQARWLVFKLRDFAGADTNLEKQLEMFRAAQQEEMQRTLNQTRLIRKTLLTIAVLAFIAVVVWGVFFLRHHRLRIR